MTDQPQPAAADLEDGFPDYSNDPPSEPRDGIVSGIRDTLGDHAGGQGL